MSKPEPLMLALSGLSSVAGWDEMVKAFTDRREEWVRDSRDPKVYGNHAELVHVNARIAECDYWLETFHDASKRAHGPTGAE